jgi:hypothetical protein
MKKMKKKPILICLASSFIFCAGLRAQALNIDPTMTTAIAVASGVETSGLSDMKANQSAIIAAQTATTGLVGQINNLQQKTLDGLTYVSTAVKNAYQLVRCYKVLQSIYDYQAKMLNECGKDPLAIILAYKAEEEMVTKAISIYGQISTMILKEDTDYLMDSGDRSRLMYNVLTDLEVVNGFSAAAYYKVHWAVIQGVVNSLNPFNHYINSDANIVKDILNTWKY